MADDNENILDVTGPEVTTILLNDDEGRYAPLSLDEARDLLGIAKGETEDVVTATVELIAEAHDENPPKVLRETSYARPLPGTVFTIDTSEWEPPAENVTWAETAKVVSDDDGHITVVPVAIFGPADHGFTAEQSRAFTSIFTMLTSNIVPDAPAPEFVDGVLGVHLLTTYRQTQFTPRIVEHRSAQQLASLDATKNLNQVLRNGAILDDATIDAATDVPNPRAVAYAVAHGRTPTHAEIVAVAEAFDYPSPIRDGWVPSGKPVFDDESDNPEHELVAKAIAAWFRGSRNTTDVTADEDDAEEAPAELEA